MARRARPRVLLADGNRVFRHGLRMLLESTEHVDVVGEAGSVATVLRDFEGQQVDVILLELEVGAESIALAVQAFRGAHDAVILTYDHLDRRTPEVDLLALDAFLAGSVGHVGDSSDPSSFTEAISLAIRGKWVMEARLKEAVFARIHGSTEEALAQLERRPQMITEREVSVLSRIAEGWTNQQIALDLGISERTVKNHITRLFAKLGVSSRGQAAAVATKRRLI